MMRISVVAAAMCAAVLLFLSTTSAAQSQAPAPSAAAAAASKPVLNLNAATVDQLETLPGIGRKTAERILEYRTKNGAFKRIEDLMNVKGIGEKSFLKLKPLIVAKPIEKASGD